MTKFEHHIFVKESEIHGKGLYTNIFIPKDEKILVIKGEVISEEECTRREEKENNVYIFWNGDNYIDVINSEKIKFINHNCNYNCEVDDKDDSSLWLIANRDIFPNEELTIDYGYDEIYTICKCEVCEITVTDETKNNLVKCY